MKTGEKSKPKTLDEIIKENPPIEVNEDLIYPNEDEEEELDTMFDEEE